MLQPGEYNSRVTFSSRGGSGGDIYGNVDGDWADQFTVYAKLLPLRGGESVMADRLSGKQPYIVIVRMSPETKQITTDWRAVNVEDPTQVFNVRSVVPDPAGDKIDILCETGVAV